MIYAKIIEINNSKSPISFWGDGECKLSQAYRDFKNGKISEYMRKTKSYSAPYYLDFLAINCFIPIKDDFFYKSIN